MRHDSLIQRRRSGRGQPAGLDRRWWTLIAVCAGTFMLLLDLTVVNVALPDIQLSLHSSFSDLQWVIDAYTLTLAAFLLTAGVTGDIFGRRRIFAGGLAVFSLSSLACGLSVSPVMLNLARGAQGIGGAIMFATSLALIAQAFSGREIGTAIGVYGAVIGGAVAIGPLVGGAITSGLGWRWIFFLNIPIGLMAIVITLAKVENLRQPNTRRIDWAGFITFSLFLFLLVYALVQGNARGWESPIIVGSFTAAAMFLFAFVVTEWRLEDPMLDLGLFRKPAMIGIVIVAFALGASIFSMFLYMTLYLQEVLGYGPLAAGVRLLPLTVLAFVAAPFAGKLTWKVSVRLLLTLGLGLIALGAHITHVDPSSPWTALVAGFVLCGIGIGIANPVVAGATVMTVRPERAGMASGVSNSARQVGIATGVAALGAVYLSQVTTSTASALAATPTGRLILHRGGSQLTRAVSMGGVREAAATIPPAARRALFDAYRIGFTSTFNHLLDIATVVALVGALASMILVRQRDFDAGVGDTATTATGPGTVEPVGASDLAIAPPARVGAPEGTRPMRAAAPIAVPELDDAGIVTEEEPLFETAQERDMIAAGRPPSGSVI